MSSASKIADFIRARDRFLISTHVFPDGDNMGSVLALAEGLRKLRKSAASFIEGPIPKMYEWMPGVDHINTRLPDALKRLGSEASDPVLLIVDSGDLERTGAAFDHWFRLHDGLEVANIDHHVSNSLFGTINWVDPGYSSVGEMVYEILGDLGVPIDPDMAQNLFVSVYTDTGRFSFSNTTERSLKYAAEFVTLGARPITAFRNVYANRTLASFHLQALSFQTLTRFLDDRGCYFWVDQDMLASTATNLDDTEGFIDTIRTLKDFLVVAFLKEVSYGDIRISVRAHPPIDASALMAIFGGGGHPRAAGCRIGAPLNDAIRIFVSKAEEAVNSGRALEKTP